MMKKRFFEYDFNDMIQLHSSIPTNFKIHLLCFQSINILVNKWTRIFNKVLVYLK